MIQKLALLTLFALLFPVSAFAAPPEALDDSAVIKRNQVKIFKVLDNDDVEEPGSITLSLETDAEHGDASISTGSKEITYTPLTDFGGTDTFTYTISDDEGSSTATVTVYVGASEVPEDFWIEMKIDNGQASIDYVQWDRIMDENFSYRLYKGTSSRNYTEYEDNYGSTLDTYFTAGDGDIPFDTFIADIQNGIVPERKRYFIAIATVLKYDTDEEEVSERSNELIVDVYPDDETAPNQPLILDAGITGPAETTVTFTGNNDEMVDFSNFTISYGPEGSVPAVRDLGKMEAPVVINDLQLDTTYTFTVTAHDYTGNTAPSQEVSLLIESTSTLLENPELFSGGCFVADSMVSDVDTQATGIGVLLLLPFLLVYICRTRLKMVAAAVFCLLALGTVAQAEDYKNIIGIKGGLLMSRDDIHELYYEENEPWVLLYYERDLSYYDLSAELEVGYLQKSGTEATSSGAPTETATDLTLVPIILSLKYNYTVMPLISVFIGGGFDYWYYKEENDDKEVNAKDDEYGVGGYHGKAGVTLMTADEDWVDRAGVTFELMYSKIDKFGGNEIDLGGISLNASLFYKF